MTIFYIALFAGTMLYIAKLISFYALMSPFPGVVKWLKAKPVRLAILDILFGFAAMNVITIAGGSVTAMLILIVFSTWSIVYLCCVYAWVKYKRSASYA